MNLYRPLNFALEELVGPEIFQERGERAWELLNPDALKTLDALRDKFGALTVNNWKSGGQFKDSGMRHFNSTVGARWSAHRYGMAFDCKFKDAKPQVVHAYILSHADEFPLLTTLEAIYATPTWLHFDCRNHQRSEIWVVNP